MTTMITYNLIVYVYNLDNIMLDRYIIIYNFKGFQDGKINISTKLSQNNITFTNK